MTNSNRPKWLDVKKLKKAAGKEAEQQGNLHVNLPVNSRKVIATYICPQCRLQFTTSDVEKQVKKAVKTGTQYIECPKCSGILREGRTAVVKDVTSIVNRADKYRDSNKAPSRGIDTWIDKAIYGRIVQRLGEHVQQYGIDNPQLKFQRGIRAQKFPGQPKTAKGAEFTIEFVDFNNTRNRIIVQAGLTIAGELICPQTFRTLSGTEYPLTKQAIDDLTSGKLYDSVMSDATIGPLTYRYPDPTRFREISADNKKIQKKAQGIDPAAMDAEIQGMGVTDPTDIQAMKDVLTKYQATPAGSTPIGAPPANTTAPATGGGAFMNGIGLSGKLNMKKTAEEGDIVKDFTKIYNETPYDSKMAEAIDKEMDEEGYFGIGFLKQDEKTGEDIPIVGEEAKKKHLEQDRVGRAYMELLNSYEISPDDYDPQKDFPDILKRAGYDVPEWGTYYLPDMDDMYIEDEPPISYITQEDEIYPNKLSPYEKERLPQPGEKFDLPGNLPEGMAIRLNMKKADVMNPYRGNPPENTMGMQPGDVDDTWEQVGVEALYGAVADGLSFPEAYEAVRTATQGNALITQAEYDQMGQIITGDTGQQGIIANKAAELIKLAEIDTIKYLHKTAETVRDEFVFDDMSSGETDQWIKTYVDTYNKTLDNGEGIITASHKAHKIAANIIAEGRVKLALRDKDTLVPLTETDPDYSIATTDEFEAEFGGKYEDTDGGILPIEDRGYNTMFKGTASEINHKTVYADVKQKDDKWVVTPKDSEKVLGEHATKNEAVKQLQAIEISKHKKGSITKTSTYQLTPSGEIALNMLDSGQQLEGFDPVSLKTILSFVLANPDITIEDFRSLVSMGGPSPYQLEVAFNRALKKDYINELPEGATQQLNIQDVKPLGEADLTSLNEIGGRDDDQLREDQSRGLTALDNVDKVEKTAEPTGVDLDADEVGQNPMNYSRLKGQIQDLLRAGNIPPSKVDIHKLKDGGYSLSELRNLIDAFKANSDSVFYPTSHAAKIDPEQLQKKAEEKLSDMFKQMPGVLDPSEEGTTENKRKVIEKQKDKNDINE